MHTCIFWLGLWVRCTYRNVGSNCCLHDLPSCLGRMHLGKPVWLGQFRLTAALSQKNTACLFSSVRSQNWNNSLGTLCLTTLQTGLPGSYVIVSLVPVKAHPTNVAPCIMLTKCYFQSEPGPGVTGEGVCVEPDVHFSVNLSVFFCCCVCYLVVWSCSVPKRFFFYVKEKIHLKIKLAIYLLHTYTIKVSS